MTAILPKIQWAGAPAKIRVLSGEVPSQLGRADALSKAYQEHRTGPPERMPKNLAQKAVRLSSEQEWASYSGNELAGRSAGSSLKVGQGLPPKAGQGLFPNAGQSLRLSPKAKGSVRPDTASSRNSQRTSTNRSTPTSRKSKSSSVASKSITSGKSLRGMRSAATKDFAKTEFSYVMSNVFGDVEHSKCNGFVQNEDLEKIRKHAADAGIDHLKESIALTGRMAQATKKMRQSKEKKRRRLGTRSRLNCSGGL